MEDDQMGFAVGFGLGVFGIVGCIMTAIVGLKLIMITFPISIAIAILSGTVIYKGGV